MKVIKRLAAIQCRFLYRYEEGRRKCQLVRWEEVKKPLILGGLGLRSFVKLNQALQEKWLWRYVRKGDMLWRRVIDAKWGTWDVGGVRSLRHGFWHEENEEEEEEEYWRREREVILLLLTSWSQNNERGPFIGLKTIKKNVLSGWNWAVIMSATAAAGWDNDGLGPVA